MIINAVTTKGKLEEGSSFFKEASMPNYISGLKHCNSNPEKFIKSQQILTFGTRQHQKIKLWGFS
jgi:hypothetical protein